MYSKTEIESRLRKLHDEIKQHPFRIGFARQDIPGYKHLLYELSEEWANMAWMCTTLSEDEAHRYRQFCRWIHDYRQNLRSWDTSSFPMRWFPFYEQVLQVTHLYLDEGLMEEYYDFNYFTDKDGRRISCVERYEWITQEKCSIDTPALPRYLPVTHKLCVDDEQVREHYMKRGYAPHKTDADREAEFEQWRVEMKPVLEWINENRASGVLTHDPWVGTI